MIALSELGGAKTAAPLYHLKIGLSRCTPVIWRLLQVPGNASLGWLHAVIQVAMGWTNSHLHQFTIGKDIYSDPSFDLSPFEDDPPILNENKAILMEVAPRQNSTIAYEYDFGDSWHHQIKVAKILKQGGAAEPGLAVCLGGERACPPEDCGGVSEYARLRRIVSSPKHQEHKAVMAWLGSKFNPAAFDLASVNTHLRKLKWPRTTQSHLRKVLFDRDGYSHMM